MGTNYYFMTKEKNLVRKHFPSNEYEIVDEPFLGYKIHLNKLSCGWRPLFQKHKPFETFMDLKKFYYANYDYLSIFDEYDQLYPWDEYEQVVTDHADIEPEPVRWVFKPSKLFGESPYLHTVRCEPEEADLWTPFNHTEYVRTERESARKFGCQSWDSEMDYTADPKYPFDWVSGEFS